MLVVHLIWAHGRFHIWAESEPRLHTILDKQLDHTDQSQHDEIDNNSAGGAEQEIQHPFAESPEELQVFLHSLGVRIDDLHASIPTTSDLQLRLPAQDGLPIPSPKLNAALTVPTRDDLEMDLITEWETFIIPSIVLNPGTALRVLTDLDGSVQTEHWSLGQSALYWITASRFITALLLEQRVVPSMAHHQQNGLSASWRPWLHDDDLRRRVGLLLRQMPPVVASIAGDEAGHNPWQILENMLSTVTDATVRRYLTEENLIDAVDGFDPKKDVHVAWLTGLLDRESRISPPVGAHEVDTLGKVRAWLSRLADTGQGREFRLRLELREPDQPLSPTGSNRNTPDRDTRWPLAFHLESTDDASVTIDADRIWALQGDIHFIGEYRLDHPHDILLRELKRAGSICPEIDRALEQSQPTLINLNTQQAHSFMRDTSPILREAGVSVILPQWWDSPEARLAVRLRIESEHLSESGAELAYSASGEPTVGLESFVKCSWRIALGEHTLTPEEFKWLTKQTSPLVQLRGQWVELRAADLDAALKFFGRNHEEEMPLRDALRLAYGPESQTAIGLPVIGMNATGWVGQLFGATGDEANDESSITHTAESIKPVPQPDGFIGSLRPYQLRGLAWFAFLERFGLGACLADDMGLGKTIQLIALLLRERELAGNMASKIGPTLLIVPTSVVGNWVREIKRFAPNLRSLVHHGSDRWSGEELTKQISNYDTVITTFALAYRDREDLCNINWWRVCLDEAQNIKNPTTKQTKAIRELNTLRRVALTGTPIENRLTELWSIMEFCNPGYLGSSHEFRRQYAAPIERYNDRDALNRLRGFVQPFILRRLKTDPRVIADLPEKLEYKVYCNLTAEQARLYETTVDEMLKRTDAAEGIKKRGLVLSLLIKLKQICNHPAHYLKKPKQAPWSSPASQGKRSGKTARLLEMLEVLLAEGDSALIFTQFREMGHLLTSLIQYEFGMKPLFLHGGTPAAKRQQFVDTFQERDGRNPVFILSLKAGGIGLNLTAANHVFHFDRWWNPAIENQATDRAFRIGQTRTVQVHKFVCSGTLEERIDQMLEQKTELAENVIGSGEQWLSDLSSDQLRDIFTLRHEDITDDEDIPDDSTTPPPTTQAVSLLGDD